MSASQTLEKVVDISNDEDLNQRPWGTFDILDEGPGYKIKRLQVKPGHGLGAQLHYHRSEHWIVVAGIVQVTCGDEQFLLSPNQSSYIPRHTIHKLYNPGVVPLTLIEVQNGEYLEDDDIIRFEGNAQSAA